jgi:cell division protein FtsW
VRRPDSTTHQQRPLPRGRRVSQLEGGGQRRHKPDYWLPLISVSLLVVGLIVIYSISPGLSAQKGVGENYYVGKQLLAIVLGVIAFIVMANIPYRFWQRWSVPLLGLGVAATILAVLMPVIPQYPAHRWVRLGSLSFQSVELLKFGLIVWLAGFITQQKQAGRMSDFRSTIKPLLIGLVVLGVVVGKVQSDFGSISVITAMMGTMAFVAGMPFKRVLQLGGIVVIGLVLLISGSAYRRDRLATFMSPERDCQNAGYQVCQALIAVGSGGMFGLGVGNSVQAYGYLPEAQNDSIFAILAEKFGFVGVTVLIGLFVAFFARLFRIAEHAPDEYAQLIVVGVLAWLSTQALINIGAMVGLLPLKGITLPFISYGGTSLVFVTGALGMIFQISRYTSFSILSSSNPQGPGYENPANRRGDRRPHYTPVSRRPGA